MVILVLGGCLVAIDLGLEIQVTEDIDLVGGARQKLVSFPPPLFPSSSFSPYTFLLPVGSLPYLRILKNNFCLLV